MTFLDWFLRKTRREPEDDGVEAEPSGISRRDFFARVAGRDQAPSPGAPGDQPSSASQPLVLGSFFVKGFLYHSGPVLVPILRTGEELRLALDPPYSRDPTGVRIERGSDLLGHVADEYLDDILSRLKRGETVLCRASRVDPAAELARVLTVEIVVPPAEPMDVDEGAAGDETQSEEGE